MTALLVAVLVGALAAAINRVRGGGLFAPILPGHPRLWAAPAMGLLSLLAGAGWLEAAAWGLGYLVWSAPAWGRWYDLGRKPVSIEPLSVTEGVVEWLAARLPTLGLHPDYVCLFVRHMLVLPCLVAVAFTGGPGWLPVLAPLFAAAVVVAYEIGRRQSFVKPLAVAEILAGLPWAGLLLV